MKPKLKLLLLLFACAAVFPLLVFEVYDQRLVLTQGFQSVFLHTNSLLVAPARYLDQLFDDGRSLLAAVEENKDLKAQLDDAKRIVFENETLRHQNESLRESLKMETRNDGHFSIMADVVSRQSPSWASKLIISKGAKAGVDKQMLVYAAGGVIGVIESVTSESAVVRLLTDSSSSLDMPIRIAGISNRYGILTRFNPDLKQFELSGFNDVTDLSVGQTIVTSDLSAFSPGNFVIGTIASIKKDATTLEVKVLVEPTSDFSNVYSVRVLGK